MSKTPEELAQIYINNLAIYKSEHPLARSCFLAGYKAAQEHAHAELEQAEARIASLRERVADLTWELEEEAL